MSVQTVYFIIIVYLSVIFTSWLLAITIVFCNYNQNIHFKTNPLGEITHENN